MPNKANYFNLTRIFILVTFVLSNCFLTGSQTLQEEEPEKRDVVRPGKVTPIEFAKSRDDPKPLQSTVVRKKVKTVKESNNKVKKIVVEEAKTEEVTALGVTIWKLRKSLPEDAYRTIEIVGAEKEGEMTPERLDGEVRVEEGSLLRIQLETHSKGYLYVFDREQYRDNSYGVPYLIYPIIGTNGEEDNNYIQPNQAILLPRQKDSYAFRLSTGKEGKIAAEILTVLITPEPLKLAPIKCVPTGKKDSYGDNFIQCIPRKITEEEFDFEAKLKEWSAPTKIAEFDLEDPKYKQISGAEILSIKNKANKLTSQAPPPQCIYTISRKPSEPYIINIPLYITKK